MPTKTIKSLSVISNPDTSTATYYCTETQWRDYSGFTNQNEFPSSEVTTHLENATEQVKKDGFHMTRYEFVTKDSEGRYFMAKRYLANRYGRDDSAMQIVSGTVSKYDLEIWEADVTSSVSSALFLQGSRVNRLMYRIPYDAITEIDALNSFFKLSSTYPTSNRQIFASYWSVGKPLDELKYELKRACMEMTSILALKKLKSKRLKNGTVTLTIGKKTITRDEATFDLMVKEYKKEYDKWIRWFKPFIGRRVRVGRMETYDARRVLNRY